jgi:hypothetical protein
MPARAERIYLYAAEADQPNRVLDFPLWWDRSGFFEQYGDREIDTGHPIYVDYALLLTPGEALAWDKQCREKYDTDPASKRPHIVSGMQRLQSALQGARWVIVESYEWESGLD